MDAVKADRASKALHQNPDYNLDGIIHTLNTLKKDTDVIFNRPPPKVEEPKAEEKKDEKKEGDAAAQSQDKPPAEGAAEPEKKADDVEMKDEGEANKDEAAK